MKSLRQSHLSFGRIKVKRSTVRNINHSLLRRFQKIVMFCQKTVVKTESSRAAELLYLHQVSSPLLRGSPGISEVINLKKQLTPKLSFSFPSNICILHHVLMYCEFRLISANLITSCSTILMIPLRFRKVFSTIDITIEKDEN